VGAAGAAEAHVPRGSARREDRQGLLRVRRAGKEEVVVDSPELTRTDNAKAAIWATLAGISQLIAVAFAQGFFPDWYFLFIALGYALLLPVLAVLHVRHAAVRQSGAILGTIAGTAAVAIGIAASASMELVVAALLVRGIWWWTIGKMWAQTGVIPRALGYFTMLLAILAIGAAVAAAPLAISAAVLWTAERLILGVWSLAVAVALWRTR
jgi:hypothetical protein